MMWVLCLWRGIPVPWRMLFILISLQHIIIGIYGLTLKTATIRDQTSSRILETPLLALIGLACLGLGFVDYINPSF